MNGVGKQVTVVCEHDKDFKIIPVRYKSRRSDGRWQEHRINSVDDVSYRIFMGDESICYECTEDDGSGETGCLLRFNIETASWDAFEIACSGVKGKSEKKSA